MNHQLSKEEMLSFIGWLVTYDGRPFRISRTVVDDKDCITVYNDANQINKMYCWFYGNVLDCIEDDNSNEQYFNFNMTCPLFDEIEQLSELSDI